MVATRAANDQDEVKLGLARESATARGIANIEFRAMNLHDWHEVAAYDVVYARFVLQHLSQPVQMLRQMWEAGWSGDPDIYRPAAALVAVAPKVCCAVEEHRADSRLSDS